MAAFLNNCRFNATAGGTTDWTYSSAVTGYQSPALAGAVNGTKYKFIAMSSDQSQWEIAEGAYNSGTGVFARTTVLYNSSGTGTATGQSGAGTKISFSSSPQVALIGIKEDLLALDELNSFTSGQQEQARINLLANRVITFTGTIVESHATNAVTFAVKTLAGNDPSATTPVIFAFPNGSGGVAFVSVTSALSITVPSGATLGASNAVAFRVWIAAFNDSGTVRLAVRVCSNYTASGLSQIVAPLENATASSTLTPANSSHVFYTTGAGVTSKFWSWIAYATYESGLTTAGTWAVSPTIVALVTHGTPRPGHKVQAALNSSGASLSLTATTTLTDSGASISFSCLSAANLTISTAFGFIYLRTGLSGAQGTAYLYRDAVALTSNAGGNIYEAATTDLMGSYMIDSYDKPNTTSAVTYKVRCQNGISSGLIQYAVGNMKVEEFMG